MNDIEEKLKKIRMEDYIWIIYIGIFCLSLYSNVIERQYIIYKDEKDKEKFRNLNIFILSIAFITSIYFVYDHYKDVQNLKQTDSEEKIFLNYYTLVGSILAMLGAFIFLSASTVDNGSDVEVPLF